MKKILSISLFIFLITFNSNSQNNIGIFIGGGITDLRTRSDDRSFDKKFNKEEANLIRAYHAGFNFENVLIERMLYLQFGLQARSSGFSAHHDSVAMFIHNIHIPLEIKFKYFFNRKGEGYIYGSAGPYFSAAYRGIQYDQEAIDYFVEDESGFGEMYNPKLKFGKALEDDLEPFDYGVNIGLGYGYSHLQIGYNFGLGISDVVPSEVQEFLIENDLGKFMLRNGYHTLTVGFYFTNN